MRPFNLQCSYLVLLASLLTLSPLGASAAVSPPPVSTPPTTPTPNNKLTIHPSNGVVNKGDLALDLTSGVATAREIIREALLCYDPHIPVYNSMLKQVDRDADAYQKAFDLYTALGKEIQEIRIRSQTPDQRFSDTQLPLQRQQAAYQDALRLLRTVEYSAAAATAAYRWLDRSALRSYSYKISGYTKAQALLKGIPDTIRAPVDFIPDLPYLERIPEDTAATLASSAAAAALDARTIKVSNQVTPAALADLDKLVQQYNKIAAQVDELHVEYLTNISKLATDLPKASAWLDWSKAHPDATDEIRQQEMNRMIGQSLSSRSGSFSILSQTGGPDDLVSKAAAELANDKAILNQEDQLLLDARNMTSSIRQYPVLLTNNYFDVPESGSIPRIARK